MKYLRNLLIICSIALFSVFAGCGKDDDDDSSSSNSFKVGSTDYSLSKGYVVDDEDSAYIYLFSSGISVSGNDMSGTGNLIEILICPATNGSYAGTYTYSSTSGANTYNYCFYELNYSVSADTYDCFGYAYPSAITITKSGSNYTITAPSCSAAQYDANSDLSTVTFSATYNGTLSAVSKKSQSIVDANFGNLAKLVKK
jgi:hypothetical protein